MTSSAPEFLHELTLPWSLDFLDPGASNVSGIPAHLCEEATLLPWKLAASHCHKHVIIILILQHQLCLAVLEDCHGLLSIFYLSLWVCARDNIFDREKRGPLWAGGSLGGSGSPHNGGVWTPGFAPLPQPRAGQPGGCQRQPQPWASAISLGMMMGSLGPVTNQAGQGWEELGTNIPQHDCGRDRAEVDRVVRGQGRTVRVLGALRILTVLSCREISKRG